MSIGYASAKSLNYPYPMRRYSQQISYSSAPTPPVTNTRRTGAAATLTSLTFINNNTSTIDNSIYEFGGGSLEAINGGDTINYSGFNTSNTGAGTAPGGFPTGLGDFCIEGWLYVPSARSRATTGDLGGLDLAGGLQIRFGQQYNTGGFNNISLFARGAADLDYAYYNWTSDTWTHFAIQRKSSSISIWADGNKLSITGGSGGGSYNFTNTSSGSIVWGGYSAGVNDENMLCYLDELCVSNSWRYNDTQSTYTIPTSAFTVDEYTCMLFHFDTNLVTASS